MRRRGIELPKQSCPCRNLQQRWLGDAPRCSFHLVVCFFVPVCSGALAPGEDYFLASCFPVWQSDPALGRHGTRPTEEAFFSFSPLSRPPPTCSVSQRWMQSGPGYFWGLRVRRCGSSLHHLTNLPPTTTTLCPHFCHRKKEEKRHTSSPLTSALVEAP